MIRPRLLYLYWRVTEFNDALRDGLEGSSIKFVKGFPKNITGYM
jgi:hypothetical protein